MYSGKCTSLEQRRLFGHLTLVNIYENQEQGPIVKISRLISPIGNAKDNCTKVSVDQNYVNLTILGNSSCK